jgi:cation transport ATPase
MTPTPRPVSSELDQAMVTGETRPVNVHQGDEVIALSVGALTLTAWLFLGQGLNYALERSVTVMVITCPHALGLAIPLVVAVSTGLSATAGC